jgi:hypothetical protein
VTVDKREWWLEESADGDVLYVVGAALGLRIARTMSILALDPTDFSMNYHSPQNWIRWNRHLQPFEVEIVSAAIEKAKLQEG